MRFLFLVAACAAGGALAQADDGSNPIVVSQQATTPASAPLAAPGLANPVAGTAATRPVTATTSGRIPRGFVRVWDDGRLNPRRAQGTPQGEAAMGRVWTNDVPRKLVETPVIPAPPTYVAVAEFATDAQRDTVVRDLRRRGLPARHGVIRGNAGDTPAVLLGPYPGPAQAAGGLSAVQSLGYKGASIL